MDYKTLPMRTDAGAGHRARIGMIVLRTDQTIEHESRRIWESVDGVALYHSRIHNDFEISRETLLAMKPRIPDAAALLPAEWAFSAIGFACTSGAMVIGDEEIERLVRQAHPNAPVSSPVRACIAAFESMDVSRIAVVTPYSRPVNDALAAGLEKRGLKVQTLVSFEVPDDNLVARCSSESLASAVEVAAADRSAQAVFVSCTSIRAVDQIQSLEKRIAKPLTSSNHALLWHLLRLSGVPFDLPRLGTLFKDRAKRGTRNLEYMQFALH